jgi:chromosome segregation ATPase
LRRVAAGWAGRDSELDLIIVQRSPPYDSLPCGGSSYASANLTCQARIAELSQQLSGAKASSSTESSTHVRGLTERAAAAEKRAGNATNQLSLLESRIAELQTKAAQAEAKWEARVKEYENRLRIAGEKIKTEKQGGKERAAQLEGQVR